MVESSEQKTNPEANFPFEAHGSDMTIRPAACKVAQLTKWKEVSPLELKVTFENEFKHNARATFDV
jgi:hypothetical protein